MQNRIARTLTVLAIATAFGVGVAAQGPQGPPPGAGGAPRQGGPGGPGGPGGGRGRGGGMAQILMESDAFPDGGIVPAKYSARGGNVMPGFKITGAPATAVAFAILFHDIDVAVGGTDDVLHWLAWNIPAASGGWPEGKLPDGSVQGLNIQKQNAYMGPGAPAGVRYHHYVFELYALSANLTLAPTATRAEFMAALAAPGVVVGKAAYVGRFRTEGGAGGPGGPGGPPAK